MTNDEFMNTPHDAQTPGALSPALLDEITPAEAVRRLREVFPAHLGYNVSVGGDMYSYARDPAVWGSAVSEGMRYEAHVWRDEWHFGTNQIRWVDGCMDDPQSLREAVEWVLRVMPFIPVQADGRALFKREVAA